MDPPFLFSGPAQRTGLCHIVSLPLWGGNKGGGSDSHRVRASPPSIPPHKGEGGAGTESTSLVPWRMAANVRPQSGGHENGHFHRRLHMRRCPVFGFGKPIPGWALPLHGLPQASRIAVQHLRDFSYGCGDDHGRDALLWRAAFLSALRIFGLRRGWRRDRNASGIVRCT